MGQTPQSFANACLRPDALGVVAKDDEHLRGRVGTNAEPLTQRGCHLLSELIKQAVVLDDLFTEIFPTSG
jgi:hypothetical protein